MSSIILRLFAYGSFDSKYGGERSDCKIKLFEYWQSDITAWMQIITGNLQCQTLAIISLLLLMYGDCLQTTEVKVSCHEQRRDWFASLHCANTILLNENSTDRRLRMQQCALDVADISADDSREKTFAILKSQRFPKRLNCSVIW